MDTKDVSLFLAIARIGSISKTAEQLFMSQSTVTTRLQRLERTLGYPLFHRLPNGVQLTAEGQRLIGLAEHMVELEEKMAAPHEDGVPVLRIMSGRAFVSYDVPACLTSMLKHTRVKLEVRMGLYEEMTEALLANQVDFCFLGEPIYHPSIKQIEFAPDAIDLIVPKDHYFNHEFPGIRALAGQPFIAFSRPNAPFRRRITNLLAKDDVFPNITMELDSIDGIKAMVSHGLGVSLLPRRTLKDAQTKGYTVIPIREPGWVRPTLLACPHDIYDAPLSKAFISVVESYYRDVEK